MNLRISIPLSICAIAAIVTIGLLARPADRPPTAATPAPQAATTLPASPYSDGGTAPPDRTGGQAAPPPAAPTELRIEGFAFPSSLSVAPGSTIDIVNTDGAPHTVDSTDGVFSSGNIDGGATVSLTAPLEPGEYSYFCAIHPSMTGVLTVG